MYFDLMRREYDYTAVFLPPEVKSRIKEIAKQERRSIGAQTLLFVERGLIDYTEHHEKLTEGAKP